MIGEIEILSIAKVCHEANTAYCESFQDYSQCHWEDAPDWQKKAAMDGVKFHIENPCSTPRKSHEEWLAAKGKDGWKYGPIKDADKKEHPCMVPYDELPENQKRKDILFAAIVDALAQPM